MTRNHWIAVSLVVAVLIVIGGLIARKSMQRVRTIPLRHLSGVEAADLLSAHVPVGSIEGWSDNNVFIRGGPSVLETAQTILQREDKPTPPVRLRFQIIEADGFTTRDTAIANVESALRGLFKFTGYRLITEAYVQTREESVAQQATAANGGIYTIAADVGKVFRREGKTSVALEVTLQYSQGVPFPPVVVLTTSVHVPFGQTIVLGSARPDEKRGAIVLVVTPEG